MEFLLGFAVGLVSAYLIWGRKLDKLKKQVFAAYGRPQMDYMASIKDAKELKNRMKGIGQAENSRSR